MKQSDAAVILIVVFVGAVLSFVLSGMLFGGAKDTFDATLVDPIHTEFPQPDQRYFNTSSVDPTRVIEIGNDAGN